MEIKVAEISLKLYLLRDITKEELQRKLCHFIDSCLVQCQEFQELHQKNKYKFYVFDSLYPVEKGGIYKKECIYTIRVRTLDKALSAYFSKNLADHSTEDMKGLAAKVKMLPQKTIDVIYSLTPVVMKDDDKYWRDELSTEEFQQRLQGNLCKKWNVFFEENRNENVEFITGIEFLNQKPVACKYKGIKLLGDKIRLHIGASKEAQEMAYFALGAGVLEMNSRGYGFMNYRWL